MLIIQTIKSNPSLKKLVHRLLVPKRQARPRLWVKFILNPFIHKKGKGSIIKRRTRLDVLPFQPFVLGDYSIIEDFSTINNGMGPIQIGSNSLVGMGNVIIGPVTIGNTVILAQNVVVSGLNHSYQDVDTPIDLQPVITLNITIEDECWIGANSVITAGVTIGRHSVVGAGSVVTKDVPPFCVVAGNPAKIIKQYNKATKCWERYSELKKV